MRAMVKNSLIAGAVKMTDTTRPLDASLTVEAGRDDYMAENGFEVADYTLPTVQLKMFGLYKEFPNSPNRQWAIPLHDMHHLATGYGTDFTGEAEVGAWELRAGCETPVVYALNALAAAIGLVISPRRVLAAYRAAKGARSLYRHPIPMEKLLAMRVGELREHLGIPVHGIAKERRLHEDAQRNRERQRAHAAEASLT
ncbi:MAG: hypothetical protein U0441_02135 [Polyangiaceae bacterium]